MKATPIPPESRDTVQQRDRMRCVRCGTAAPYGEWHHRRSRRVRDGLEHSPANGIWLCHDCHTWCHTNPLLARQQGWIVSQHETEVDQVPIRHYLYGVVILDHDGGWSGVEVVET